MMYVAPTRTSSAHPTVVTADDTSARIAATSPPAATRIRMAVNHGSQNPPLIAWVALVRTPSSGARKSGVTTRLNRPCVNAETDALADMRKLATPVWAFGRTSDPGTHPLS